MTEPETVTAANQDENRVMVREAPDHPVKKLTNGAVVRARDLCKYYGQVQVVTSLDFDLGARERVALIGPSGCGKTTVLRMVMGLERPTSGTVQIDGAHLWHREVGGKLLPAREKDLRKVRAQIGMVFQQFNLFPHMTALQNVLEGPLHVRKLAKDEAVELARHMLDLVGLAQHADKRPGQMSGGQQQRVGIARALAMQPKVMLFDEVTSSLDPELVGEVLRVIREIADSTAIAMIIVTHEMRFAEKMADRVLMFDGGQVVEEGSAERIFHDPREERTRKFLNALSQDLHGTTNPQRMDERNTDMKGIDRRTAGPGIASRRSVLRAGLAGGVLAIGGGGLLTACSSSTSTASSASSPSGTGSVSPTLAKMRSSGAVLGVADAPPYSSINTSGEVVGLGPDVTIAVLKSLGVTSFKGVVGTYATMVPGMEAGRWQMIAAVLEITKARCAQILYADPIEFDGAAWGYLPSYTDPPTSLKGAPKNIKIGVLTGAYLIPLALAAGFSNANILQFPDRPSLVAGLKAGRVTLALNTTVAMEQLAKQENYSFKVTGNLTDVPIDGSSVAFSQSDPAFYNEFQTGLASLRSSGQLTKIQAQWGFPAETAAEAKISAQAACASASS